MQITSKDLLALGFKTGKQFGQTLARVKQLEAEGTSREAILELLAQEVEVAVKEASKPKLRMKEEMTVLREAITAVTPDELDNITKVKKDMVRLGQSPVVEAVAVMPDACPAGSEEAGISVGGAIAVKNAIVPYSTSADLCCSMYATFFESDRPVAELMDDLQESTRFGAGGRNPHEIVKHEVTDEEVWKNPFLDGLKSYAVKHMADQGDGNHFAYIGEVVNCEKLANHLETAGYAELSKEFRKHETLKVLVTHHGSRGLGAQVYKRGLDAAVKQTNEIAEGIPKAAAWIDYNTKQGEDYWDALQYVSRWTEANHQAIHHIFLTKSGAKKATAFGNQHNFCWVKPTKENNGEPIKGKENIFLHGKGATPAWTDAHGRPLLGLIPLNMAANIMIVLGSDNEKYLSFAPHGAGRNFSRSTLTKQFKDDRGNLQETMVKKRLAELTKGLDIRWFSGRPDISESPLGYKDAESIKREIKKFGLAKVIAEIKPLGCIMAGDQPKFWELARQTKKQKRQLQHRSERRKIHADLKNLDIE